MTNLTKIGQIGHIWRYDLNSDIMLNMKNINKLLFTLLFVSFILPNLAFASWWNPFSWNIWKVFSSSENKSLQVEIDQPKNGNITFATSTFYTQSDNVNVRDCASIDCNVVMARSNLAI